MTSQNSPFDDPTIRRAMQQAGIQHGPGLAADLLEQLTPLLAADGIDLDDLDDLDPEQLDAAMSRAVEHHNLTLFTPTGRHRELALAVLRAVAESLAAGEEDAVARVLGSVQPEPTDIRPAASHVIGLSLGLIDRWEADSELQPRLRRRRIPKLLGRRIAADLLALGQRRRAFDSLQGFVVKHGGETLMHGASLAAAATVAAVAQHDGVDIAQALSDLIGVEVEELADVGAGAGFGIGMQKPNMVDESDSRERFVRWLHIQYGHGSPMVDAQLQLIDTLLSFAAQEGIDPRSAEDIASMAAMLAQAPDVEARDSGLDGLLDYAHFRYDDSGGSPEWATALEKIEGLLALVHGLDDDDDDEPTVLLTAIDAEASVPPEQLEAAVAQVRPVAAVPQLLDWLGQSKPITATGSVRRADIAAVAAMLGIRAEGVASLPAAPEPGTHFVTSMRDLAPLDAWWESLVITEVVELTSSRARPGTAVRDEETRLAPQTASMLVSAFVAQLVTHALDLTAATPGQRAFTQLVLARVEELLDPERDPGDSILSFISGDLVLAELESLLQALRDAGVLADVDGRPLVPVPLRGVVARGLMIGRRYLLIAEDIDD